MAGLDTSFYNIKPIDYGDPVADARAAREGQMRNQLQALQMRQGEFNLMKGQVEFQRSQQAAAQAAAEKKRSDAAEKQFNAFVPGYITPEGTTTYKSRDVADVQSPGAGSDVGMLGSEMAPDNFKEITEKTAPKIDYQGLAARAASMGNKYGWGYADQMFQLGKKNEEYLKANEETSKKKLDDAWSNVGPLVMQAQSPQDIADWTRRVYSDPVLGAEARKMKTVDKAIEDNIRQFQQNPDQFRMVMGKMMNGEKLYEMTRMTPDIDKSTGIDMNYRSKTFGERLVNVPQTAAGKGNAELTAAYATQEKVEAQAKELDAKGDTEGAARLRERAQEQVDNIKSQIDKDTNIPDPKGSAPKTQFVVNDRGDGRLMDLQTGAQIGETQYGVGKQGGTYAKAQEARAKATRDMEAAIPELKELIKPGSILQKSTSSGAGALADSVAGFVGWGTEGAQAAASLKVVADRFTKMIPRFEGPQSDGDRKSYETAAAQLANERAPYSVRLAAAKELLRITENRRGQFGYADEDAVPNLYSPNQSGSGQDKQSGPYAPGTRVSTGTAPTQGEVNFGDLK